MVTRRISLFFQVIVVNASELWLVNEQRWLSNVSRFILIISFKKLRNQLIFQTFDASCKFNDHFFTFLSSSPRDYLQQASAIIGTENERYTGWMCLVFLCLRKMAEVVNIKTAAQNTQKWRSAETVIRVKVPVARSRGTFFLTIRFPLIQD